MPSLYEGLPVAGVQALQSGLAIVASAIGGFQDLVEHGKNGFLCSPTDARELSEKLTLFLTDREELMRAKNHSLEVAKKFDIQKVADQYESVLLSAINQPLK